MQIGLTVGDSIDRISHLGPEFDFVELGIGEGAVTEGEYEPSSIMSEVAAVDAELCVHLPFSQDLVTPVPEINEGIVQFLDRLLEWAGKAGAKRAVIHGTARDPHDLELRPRFAGQLSRINNVAGDHGVELVVENVGHQRKGLQLTVLGDIAKETGTAICFDVGHAYMEDRMDGVKRFLKRYATQIAHLHVHDVRSRGDTHLPVGAGEIDYSVVAQHLDGFDGTVAIEVFTDDEPLLQDSKNRIERILARSP